MGIVAWIALGLLAGLIARAVYPGKQPFGVIGTLVLGVVGALLGGWIGRLATGSGVTGLTVESVIWATLGAVLVLFCWGLFAGRRGRGSALP